MTMKKLVILEPLGIPQDKLLAMVREAAGDSVEVIAYDTRATDPETLAERAGDADAVVLSNLPFPRAVIEKCTRLQLVNVAFTGVDLVDTGYCKERGITVCNCAGYSTVAVADLVFGMVIALARNLIPCGDAVRGGKTKDGLVGFELAGKKFGVVGTGAIGLRTAAIAEAFGCEVLAYSRTEKPETGLRYVSLETLLRECDIVSLHVPATPQTTGLINAERLALMKKTALLINTARGPVVDSAALAKALEKGDLAGAGIDVFETEPPVATDHPLLHAPHVVATPHVAFATAQAMEKRAVIVCENLKAWLGGKPQNVIVSCI